MSDYTQTKLAIENSLRSPTKVRQLTPEQLGIPGTDEGDRWDALIKRAEEAAEGSQVGVAVRTENGSVTTGTPLSKGSSHDVHALEFAIWKAYEQEQSPIAEVAITVQGPLEEPCGRCLQVLSDYSDEVNPKIHISSGDEAERVSLGELLRC